MTGKEVYKSLNWVNVKDKLPKKDGKYLVLGPYNNMIQVLLADYSKKKKNRSLFESEKTDSEKITHWIHPKDFLLNK